VATVDGEPVKVAGRKPLALLVLLALNAGRPVGVDRLIEGLWGDDAPDSALNALQVYIAGLRRDLHAAGRRIQTDGQAYRLDLEPSDVDALAFEAAVQRARAGAGDSRSWHECVALWTGDPFNDLPFAPFTTAYAARLRETFMSALEARIDADLAEGHHGELVPELEAMLVEEPYRERTWRQLMLALYRDGRQADALATYQRATAALADELGLDPSPALAVLERAILNQDPALEPPVQATGLGVRLPQPPTELVGRQAELAELRELVERVPLTTLLGPGGMGKTRLAMEVGANLADTFSDGVVFVDLAAITDREPIFSEIARAIGAPSDAPLDALVSALGGRRVLLILDNVEQIPGAGVAIRSLLDRVRGVHLLVTTRVLLRVRGEEVVPLGPLDRAAGAELFVRRMRAGRAEGPDEALARRVVARLDGLPLAIELAAAAARTLARTELIDRLERGIPLPSGPHDLPERQQTMEATIRWSATLLSETARETWAAVAEFASPFTLAAAAGVAGREVTEDVADLVDASVLTLSDGRYQMLPSLRAAATVLFPDPAARAARTDAHAQWALDAATTQEARLHSPEELEARAELRRILPDLRIAFDRLLATERADDAARLLVATANMWYHEGLTPELRARLDGVVGSERLSPRTGGEARVLRAVLGKLAGEAGAGDVLRRELGWLRAAAPDSVTLVNGLCHLADLEADAGHADEAFRLADEAVEVAHRTADDGSVVMALDLASYVAQVLGNVSRAVEASRGALRVAATGPTPQRINALAGLAVALHRAEQTDEAVDSAWQALAEAEAHGSPVQTAEVIVTVAEVLRTSDAGRVLPLLASGLVTFLAFGGMRNAVRIGAILMDSSVALAPAETARLLGALEARTPSELGSPFDATIATLRKALGPEVFARERAAGRGLGDDDLARLATAVVGLRETRVAEGQPPGS
jgi:predicted ATPase/DNA-binding SARP family transcriptional activator